MGILEGFFRASLENPRFTLNDPEAWEYLGGSGPASSGFRVTPESALTDSPWFRGINLIATSLGKVPLHLYRRDGEGKARATEHPAYYLLRRKPNPYQTAYQFRLVLTGHALSRGNGYAYIYRRGDGSPLELWPLDPAATYPLRESDTGQVWYVTEADGQERKLPAEDVLHIKGLGYDGLCGYSVVEKARESLGLGLGARKYQSIQFKNAGRPAAVLETPNKLTDIAKRNLRETWERMHSGLDNAHRTAVLDNGLKLHAYSFSPEDAQLIQTHEFHIVDISNFIGVPPHKLGSSARTAYNSLEQENQSFLDESLDPWMVNWEEECWDKLLTEQEKEEDTHIVEFLRAALVRADIGARGTYYQRATGNRPWMTPDEVRARENMNPLGGVASELVPAAAASPSPAMQEDVADGEEDMDEPEGSRLTPGRSEALADALRANLEDAARRVVRRITVHARRTSKESWAYCQWLDAFREEHLDVATEMITPAIAAVNAWGLLQFTPRGVASDLLQALHTGLSRLAETCTPARLAATVDQWCADMEAAIPAGLANQKMGVKS